MRAVTIIQDEHRAITAVIEGLRHLVAEVAAGRIVADQALLAALFHYIEAFPERLHHPKEDEHLFADANINIEYAYCATTPDARHGMMILRPSNPKKALKVLNSGV